MISPRAFLTGLLLVTSGLCYVACGSDSGTTTSTGTEPVTASASSGATGTTGSGTGGSSSTGTSSATSSSSGAGGAGGCFAGTPTTNDQFLNSCNGQTCQHYDNSQLTKLSTDGGLPPLP